MSDEKSPNELRRLTAELIGASVASAVADADVTDPESDIARALDAVSRDLALTSDQERVVAGLASTVGQLMIAAAHLDELRESLPALVEDLREDMRELIAENRALQGLPPSQQAEHDNSDAGGDEDDTPVDVLAYWSRISVEMFKEDLGD